MTTTTAELEARAKPFLFGWGSISTLLADCLTALRQRDEELARLTEALASAAGDLKAWATMGNSYAMSAYLSASAALHKNDDARASEPSATHVARIKDYRNKNGCSLIEAKNAIEAENARASEPRSEKGDV